MKLNNEIIITLVYNKKLLGTIQGVSYKFLKVENVTP